MLLLVCALLAGTLDDDERFTAAVARFRALEYEAALAEFEAIAAEPRPEDERAQAMLWVGAARALLGDDGAARLAFESALLLDPDVTLDFKTSPKVVQLFDEVREKHPPPAPPPPEPPVEEEPPAPAPPPPTTPAPSSSINGFWLLAAGAGVLGVAAGVTAGVFGVGAYDKIRSAEDPATSQQDAVALEGDINTDLLVAGVLGGATVALAVTAIAGIFLAAE